MFTDVLSAEGTATLASLAASELTKDFYLAGGTALALQFGHRRSIDLDWFTPQPFEPGDLLLQLQNSDDITISQQTAGTLHIVFKDTRVSFFHYPYPLIEPLAVLNGVRMAGPVEIGLMKIIAIANRGSRKDFYDLYQIVKRVEPLQSLFGRLPRKYPRLHYSTYHLVRSLGYFAEAEQEPEPMLIQPVSWREVTDFFRHEQSEMMRQFKQESPI